MTLQLSRSNPEIDPTRILNPENEDQEFLGDYNIVINDKGVKKPDEDYQDRGYEHILYVDMEIGLTGGKDGELKLVRVKRHVVDVEGRTWNLPNSNPLLDSRQYETGSSPRFPL